MKQSEPITRRLGGSLKVVHVISGLNMGGAEMMLFKLLSVWERPCDEVEVVSLTDRGVFAKRIEALGIQVTALEMPRGRPSLGGLIRLARRFRRGPRVIVHCWMYHGNLIGGLAAWLGGKREIIWGIRSSSLDDVGNRRSTILTAKAAARLSALPRKIVCCSENARQLHVEMGYRADRMLVIPNGFDLARFKPDQAAKESVRQELGLADDTVLIGFVARFDPQKDHRSFIEAARLIAAKHRRVHFLLCGHQLDWTNETVCGWVERAGLKENFHLLGRRDDVARITAALDIAACSSSFGEAFPNVLGEAMACGVPCATTDVGDSAYIVGDTGIVVPPGAPALMADAWMKLIIGGEGYRRELGMRARGRVEKHFELKSVAARYHNLYAGIEASATQAS